MSDWPDWWLWEPEFSPHLQKRMIDRDFNEVAIRSMLEDATGFRRDIDEARWVIETGHEGRAWEVIVEPIEAERKLVLVTAYPLS